MSMNNQIIPFQVSDVALRPLVYNNGCINASDGLILQHFFNLFLLQQR